MNKQKTKKILSKKIKISKTGKIMRSHQLRSGHLRTNKSKNALRRHKVSREIDKTLQKSYNRLLGRS